MVSAKKNGTPYIGCSGFSYDKWLGMFYPEDVDKKRLLAYYSRYFNTVEINRSFYRLLSASTVSKWMAETPPDFRFVFKISRYITHTKKLLEPEKHVQKFVAPLGGAKGKLGPLLLQLPPSLKPHYERLDAALRAVQASGRSLQVAVECRRDDWYGDALNDLLDEHRAALVIHDMPAGRNRTPNPAAPFLYIRYHGPHGDYGGTYSAERLKDEAARMIGWLAQGRNVYAYFNNDRDGCAPFDAQRLKGYLPSADACRSEADS